jgi:nitrogen regulatory protein PII
MTGHHADQYAEIRAVRIICDSVLKDRVLTELHALGATGFTWWEVHGEGTVTEIGTMGVLHRPNVGLSRIYFEVWCHSTVADKIVAYCQGTRFEGIGMIVGLEPLLVHKDEAAKLNK